MYQKLVEWTDPLSRLWENVPQYLFKASHEELHTIKSTYPFKYDKYAYKLCVCKYYVKSSVLVSSFNIIVHTSS